MTVDVCLHYSTQSPDLDLFANGNSSPPLSSHPLPSPFHANPRVKGRRQPFGSRDRGNTPTYNTSSSSTGRGGTLGRNLTVPRSNPTVPRQTGSRGAGRGKGVGERPASAGGRDIIGTGGGVIGPGARGLRRDKEKSESSDLEERILEDLLDE